MPKSGKNIIQHPKPLLVTRLRVFLNKHDKKHKTILTEFNKTMKELNLTPKDPIPNDEEANKCYIKSILDL